MKVIIYVRISRDRAGAGLGVERQRQDCEDLAHHNGWTVVEVYTDNDMSAYSKRPRSGYLALLEDLKAGRADAVVAWHADRLHRRLTELEDYIDICEQRGVTTYTVKAGHIDLATPSGRMVARQLGVVARYEVEHMVERAKRAKLQAATAGRWKGGRRPYGYAADGVTVIPHEAAVVLRATQDILTGLSLHAISRALNARDITTSGGKPWQATELRRVLLRPRNAGLMVHQGEVVHLDTPPWPAIVPEDVWRAAVAVLTNPDRRTTTGNARRWLGSGLYLCGVCADGMTMRASMSGGRGRTNRTVYRCKTAIHLGRDAIRLDAYVEAVVIERLSRPDIAAVLEPAPREDTTELHMEAIVLRRRLDELATAHADGVIDMRQLGAGTERLHLRLEDVERRITAAAEGTALAGLVGADAATVWQGLDISRKRAVIGALMTVTVHRAPRGRTPGWTSGHGYFDPKSVEIVWRS